MKKLLLGFFMAGLLLSAMGQNLFQNSDMETQGDWQVLRLQNSGGDIDVQFGIALTPPTGGSGNCMEATLAHLNVDGTGQVFVYQLLDLEGGKMYKFKGFVKDISDTLQNTWVECLWIDPNELPEEDSGDIGGNKFAGLNIWNGCGWHVDGNIVHYTCDGSPAYRDSLAGYVYFAIPDTLGDTAVVGETVTLAVGFTIGMWANTELTFDLLFDDFYVADSAGSSGIPLSEQTLLKLSSYPNPAKGNATIYYEVPEAGNVNLTVYNIVGSKVATLYYGRKEAGSYRQDLNTSILPNGAYFCKLELNNQVVTHRFTILK